MSTCGQFYLLVQPSLFGHHCFGISVHRVGALSKCSLSGNTRALRVRTDIEKEDKYGLYNCLFIKYQAIYSL